MCGICGIYSFNETGKQIHSRLNKAVEKLRQRGPDSNGTFFHNNVALGHARLSVIDTSNAASQPFSDASGRYTIIFNGEFYNFREHKNKLIEKGYIFRSESDTEVLLQLFIDEGPGFIKKVNGCFAIAIYDNVAEELVLYRDRYGIKPLVFFQDADGLRFASEMKSLLELNVKKDLDFESLYLYLQLNYIPAPWSIFKNVRKLMPGNYMRISKNSIETTTYYSVNRTINPEISYQEAQHKLAGLLEKAVKRRLISDVPLGAFLSGGIDSSVVVALASKYVNQMNTFSIGYKNNPFFDETNYAQLVAKKYNTNHTVFSLTNDDLLQSVDDVLNYTDEPFADSSAVPVYILSWLTRQHVTVALSGDGADEVFAGYHKHRAHLKASKNNLSNLLLRESGFLFNMLPKSRNNPVTNKFRQLSRYSEGLSMKKQDRYWRWCSFIDKNQAEKYFNDFVPKEFRKRKENYTSLIQGNSMNDILFADVNLVLQNDMLVKVDLMSMANSLEVRSPFLDYTVIDFAFSLNQNFKIDEKMKKKIVQDAFRSILPDEIYNRPKHGFEVPMLGWLRGELSEKIDELLLNRSFIEQQGIFNYYTIRTLYNKLHSTDPEDSHATIWALLVFQHWWKNYFN